MLIPDKIETLIFDLGGVIIDLDVEGTMKAFAALSGLSISRVEDTYESDRGFDDFEKGLIDNKAFRDHVRKSLNIKSSDDEIDAAWNSMLAGVTKKKLELIENLKGEFQVFILSNTNAIHIGHLEKKMLPGIGLSGPLGRFVHKTYYSYELQMVKPEPEVFKHILKENKMEGDNVLFLDDHLENVTAAKRLGVHSIQITRPDMLFDIFK